MTGYTKLLSDPATQRRFYVMLEATRVLGDDAFPVLVARLTDPKEPVETKLEYLRQLCYDGPPAFEKRGRAGELMRAFAATQPARDGGARGARVLSARS